MGIIAQSKTGLSRQDIQNIPPISVNNKIKRNSIFFTVIKFTTQFKKVNIIFILKINLTPQPNLIILTVKLDSASENPVKNTGFISFAKLCVWFAIEVYLLIDLFIWLEGTLTQ